MAETLTMPGFDPVRLTSIFDLIDESIRETTSVGKRYEDITIMFPLHWEWAVHEHFIWQSPAFLKADITNLRYKYHDVKVTFNSPTEYLYVYTVDWQQHPKWMNRLRHIIDLNLNTFVQEY